MLGSFYDNDRQSDIGAIFSRYGLDNCALVLLARRCALTAHLPVTVYRLDRTLPRGILYSNPNGYQQDGGWSERSYQT
jgi:hypothetical protein